MKRSRRAYVAPRVEHIALSSPQSVLQTLSYPGVIYGDFDDLINQADWLENEVPS